MSLTASEMTPADIAAVTGGGGGGGYGGNGMFGDGAWWIIVLFLFAGWGRGGGFGGGGGCGGGGYGANSSCATPADVRAAVDQQTLISKLDQSVYGQADVFNSLNNTLNQNFRNIDNAVCTLGYQAAQHASNLAAQLAQCCCDTRYAIGEVNTGIERNGWQISKQISDCCCDLEKANMQNRFDAQVYNCNTLQAIDKLGDRIIDYMSNEKVQALRDENQALRLAASQSNQNAVLRAAIDASTAEIIRRTGNDCPVPAYVVNGPTPVNFSTNCCGQVQYAGSGCNSGCGGF